MATLGLLALIAAVLLVAFGGASRRNAVWIERVLADRRATNELCECRSEFDSASRSRGDEAALSVHCRSCQILLEEPIIGHSILFDLWKDQIRCRLACALATDSAAVSKLVDDLRRGPGDGTARATEALILLKQVTDDEVEVCRRSGEAGWMEWRTNHVTEKLQAYLERARRQREGKQS